MDVYLYKYKTFSICVLAAIEVFVLASAYCNN